MFQQAARKHRCRVNNDVHKCYSAYYGTCESECPRCKWHVAKDEQCLCGAMMCSILNDVVHRYKVKIFFA